MTAPETTECRVVHVCRQFLAPTETFIHTQLAMLEGCDSWVITRQQSNQHLFPYSQLRSFQVRPTTPRGLIADVAYKFVRVMTSFERDFVLAQARSLNPSLVHAHYAVDARYFLPVIRALRVPLVVSCYGYDVSSFPNRLGGIGRRYLAKVWEQAAIVLAMSADMAQDLIRIGCPSERIKIHYHGINLERFPRIDERSGLNQRILFVGSLGDERKRVDDVIRAFAQIANRFPRLELRIVGAGRLMAKHQRLADGLDVAQRVSFAGFIPQAKLVDEFRRASIFCHPSATTATGDKEGIPGTIVEAMATGLPIVATNHAGIPEIVGHGKHGLLVAERDHNALAEGLSELLADECKRLTMGRAAAEQARDKADARVQARKLTEIYRTVIESNNQHRLYPKNS